MKKNARIFVAGSNGLVGSALVRRLRVEGYTNLLLPGFDELDLTNQAAVTDFFSQKKPDYVFLAAAKVGGIHANNSYPADFIYQNLMIQSNVIHQSYVHKVKRLLFLGSSCIYPKFASQPMVEDSLLTGGLEPTNEPYAIAKIAGIKMCESYNRQYGTQFAAVMPTNLYGPGDNFHPENSHVLPALIRRFHEAKVTGSSEVVIWGTGTPMREFLYVDDMADGCVFVMELDDRFIAEHLFSYPNPCFVNLGTGVDVTICQLADIVKHVVGYQGEFMFDATRPDGTPRKLIDVSKMTGMGWVSSTKLEDGIATTYAWYLQHIDKCRA